MKTGTSKDTRCPIWEDLALIGCCIKDAKLRLPLIYIELLSTNRHTHTLEVILSPSLYFWMSFWEK